MATERNVRLGMKISEDEKKMFDKVKSDMGLSMVDMVVKVVSDIHEARFETVQLKASIALERITENGTANYFTILDITGSIPRYAMSAGELESFVMTYTGKSLDVWKKAATELVANGGAV